MSLASVNPNQVSTAPPPAQDDTGSSANGVNVPQTPIPGSNGIDTQAMATMRGDTAMTQAMNNVATQSGKSSSSSGGIFGAIGSVVGKVLPFLFSKGGTVGYAGGGPTDNMTYGSGQTIEPGPAQPSDPNAPNVMQHALGVGYAIGALHQRDFGGTPDTLEKAASIIGNMAGSNDQQHFAVGGSVAPTGVMPTNQQPQMGAIPPPNQQPMQPQMPPQNAVQHPIARGYMARNMGMPQQPQVGYNSIMTPNRFAAGGGVPPNGPPPLQPGQPFQGDGAVKGPGGPSDDAIPAKLSNGEYVMSAPAVAFFGVDKMDKMNDQGKQGFIQSKMQVQANQDAGGPPGGPLQPPSGSPGAAPPQGNGMMPQMPTMQAKGGPAVQRSRGSGFMGV